MQTILGAGGPIGDELARLLPDYTDRVRLVSRHPKPVAGSDEIVAADLTDAAATRRAVAGSDVVYLVAGLAYRARVWQRQWPRIMRNVLDACSEHGARLVFFDNVYMYDRDALSPMDETTPVRPTSDKGRVRADIAEMLLEAAGAGQVQALIARCADYYGPGRQAHGVLAVTVFERLAADKPAQWLLSADHRHSFTYTPDAARATAMLGNTESACGEVWHLPTAPHPPTGREWVEMIAAEMGTTPRLSVVSGFMLGLAALFSADMRELREMAYQYDRDYDFVSDKFNTRFGFEPTPYPEGIRAVVEADYR